MPASGFYFVALMFLPRAFAGPGADPTTIQPGSCAELARVNQQQAGLGSLGTVAPLREDLRPGTLDGEEECAGLLLSYSASVSAISGRFSEAETDARRSLAILRKRHTPDDRTLTRPLHTLGEVLLQLGKTSEARRVNQQLHAIPIQNAEERQLVHLLSAELQYVDRRYKEAEAECLKALAAIDELGRGATGDAGATLNALAVIYIEDRRFPEAQRALDRQSEILANTKDWVPLDSIRIRSTQGHLFSQEQRWTDAERELREAIAIAERENVLSPSHLARLLSDYGAVLRKTHRRAEAKSVEARADAMYRRRRAEPVVDVADLAGGKSLGKK